MNMPGRVWYVVAALIWLGGWVLAGSYLWQQLSALQAGLTRVIVPGSAVLDLKETGSYTIFHEAYGTIDGTVYASPNISGLRVQLRPEPSGEPIALSPPSANSRYSVGGHSGYAVLAFDLAAPGRYRLTGSYDDARTEPKTVLALGRGFVGNLLTTIFGTLGIALVGSGAGAAIAVITFVKRRRARRAARI